jgi:3'(2'), 5'-bisphosphate nucleotidase
MSRQDTLLNSINEIARTAGQIIMSVYASGDFKTTYKTDKTPLTRADTLANDHIVKCLHELTPRLAIVSEESLNDKQLNFGQSQTFWLVDPLDGTSDFLDRNDEFTVNIALIRRGRPVLGVVYAPALDILYYATKAGARKEAGATAPLGLPIKSKRRRPLAVVSRSHLDSQTAAWLKQHNLGEPLRVGSSLKLCYLSDGTADFYPRFAPLMKWDIAAAGYILEVAGGKILEILSQQPPSYDRSDYHQSPFIATRRQSSTRDFTLALDPKN